MLAYFCMFSFCLLLLLLLWWCEHSLRFLLLKSYLMCILAFVGGHWAMLRKDVVLDHSMLAYERSQCKLITAIVSVQTALRPAAQSLRLQCCNCVISMGNTAFACKNCGISRNPLRPIKKKKKTRAKDIPELHDIHLQTATIVHDYVALVSRSGAGKLC